VETLRVLVEQPDVVISKEALLSKIWPGTFVEESGLTRNICDLRHALSDLSGASFIQTVPRRGYRFVAPVSELEDFAHFNRQVIAILPFRALDELDPTIGSRIAEALVPLLARQLSFCVRLARGQQTEHGMNKHAHSNGLAEADFLLNGILQKQGKKVRVSVHLENTKLRNTVWAETFEESSSDLFKLQDTLAEEIAGAVVLLMSTEQPKMLSRRYTESRVAYRLYLRGRFHWSQRSETETRKAISCFRSALAEDPEYAPAYSAISSSYAMLPMVSTLRPHDWMPKAKAAAISALQIDEGLAEARAALAFVQWHYEWNWMEAEREYRRIITFQPDHAIAHQWYGLLLAEMGRRPEAMKHAALACELDPSPCFRANQACVLLYCGHHREAYDLARETLAVSPDSLRARVILALALQQMGDSAGAIRLMEALRSSRAGHLIYGALGHAYAASGRRAEACGVLRKLQDLPRGRCDFSSQALVHIGAGDKRAALDELEKACEEREFYLVIFGVDPRWDCLRGEPRFQAVLERIGLSERIQRKQ
jgi:serine/threonine-protein kinase